MTSSTPEHEYEPLIVRDKRRIDPETGAVRPEAASVPVSPAPVSSEGGAPPATPAPATPADGATAGLAAELAGAIADLQRERADYANYRRRMDRERAADRERATIAALTELLPVLDNVERARAHGEVVGGFKMVAESLEASLAKLGLVSFAEPGDPFDPNVHEALMHEHSAEVIEPTCVEILQSGYKVGERIVRPARVKVAEPEPTNWPGGGRAP